MKKHRRRRAYGIVVWKYNWETTQRYSPVKVVPILRVHSSRGYFRLKRWFFLFFFVTRKTSTSIGDTQALPDLRSICYRHGRNAERKVQAFVSSVFSEQILKDVTGWLLLLVRCSFRTIFQRFARIFCSTCFFLGPAFGGTYVAAVIFQDPRVPGSNKVLLGPVFLTDCLHETHAEWTWPLLLRYFLVVVAFHLALFSQCLLYFPTWLTSNQAQERNLPSQPHQDSGPDVDTGFVGTKKKKHTVRTETLNRTKDDCFLPEPRM